MKDYFFYQGNTNITGSRDEVRESFNKGLITDGEGWMEMIKSRNQTSHTYNLQVANEIEEKIINQYSSLAIFPRTVRPEGVRSTRLEGLFDIYQS